MGSVGMSASSSVVRTVVSLGSAPSTGAWRAQQGDAGHAGGPERAMDTSAMPGPPAGTFRPAQRRPQRGGQPGLGGQRAQQHRPGVPAQALAVPGHSQRAIPARILHDEERSRLTDCTGVVTA